MACKTSRGEGRTQIGDVIFPYIDMCLIIYLAAKMAEIKKFDPR